MNLYSVRRGKICKGIIVERLDEPFEASQGRLKGFLVTFADFRLSMLNLFGQLKRKDLRLNDGQKRLPLLSSLIIFPSKILIKIFRSCLIRFEFIIIYFFIEATGKAAQWKK